MKTTIRLLSGIMIGALLAGCATELTSAKKTERNSPM